MSKTSHPHLAQSYMINNESLIRNTDVLMPHEGKLDVTVFVKKHYVGIERFGKDLYTNRAPSNCE